MTEINGTFKVFSADPEQVYLESIEHQQLVAQLHECFQGFHELYQREKDTTNQS